MHADDTSTKKVFTIHEHRIESEKEYIAFLKHLATLNTGSIGLIAVFAKDFKAAIQSNTIFLTVAVYGFTLSLFLSLVCYAITLFGFFGFSGHIRQENKKWAYVFFMLSALSAAFFVVALGRRRPAYLHHENIHNKTQLDSG